MLQAILFDVNQWTNTQCHAYMNKHHIYPIKRQHVTDNFRRFRIVQPDYIKYKYRTITIQTNPLIKGIVYGNIFKDKTI